MSKAVSEQNESVMRELVNDVLFGAIEITAVADDQLVAVLSFLNAAYRRGEPVVGDEVYDGIFLAELQERNPSHPFLTTVEPEPEATFSGNRVRHPRPMLSTEKAYTIEDLARWVNRVRRGAEAAGFNPDTIDLCLTPKLDGIAGRDDGERLVTRGDGLHGEDVTIAFERGVVPVGGRGLGLGEIVVDLAFFNEHLAEDFDHPRNFVAGLIGADTLKVHHHKALRAGAVRFVPYSQVPSRIIPLADVLSLTPDQWMFTDVEYLTDGSVLHVLDEDLQAALGETSHHPRWNLALKVRGDQAVTTVEKVTLQVGRTGRITPVLEIAPVRLSGATLSRATAHTARHLAENGLGPGAVIEIIRSGEVIPKVMRVLERSESIPDTTVCPECGTPTEPEGEAHLVCPNTAGCAPQASCALQHFFGTLRIKGFGPATTDRLVEAGIVRPRQVYDLEQSDFEKLGFGPGQASNLTDALDASLEELVFDWQFLAAFGIRSLGRGDSRRLLRHHPIQSLNTLSVEDLVKIEGFGQTTAERILSGITELWDEIAHLMDMFQLEITTGAGNDAAPAATGPLAGKKVVFTGSLQQGSRDEMRALARKHGAEDQSSVSSKTDFLICGEKVGASKISKAEKLGVKVITEAEFMAMIEEPAAA